MQLVVIDGTGPDRPKLVRKLRKMSRNALARIARYLNRHVPGQGPRRSASRRAGRRRYLELTVIRGQGGDHVIPNRIEQPTRRVRGRWRG